MSDVAGQGGGGISGVAGQSWSGGISDVHVAGQSWSGGISGVAGHVS